MRAVDTNVLIYAHDPSYPAKQATAISLIQSLTDGALLWQVACEYLSASHKLEPFGYDRAQAWRDIRAFQRVWTTVLPGWKVLDRSEELLARYSLSFWDPMIIASCLQAGIDQLYSEDFDAYPFVNGLQVTNPFRDL